MNYYQVSAFFSFLHCLHFYAQLATSTCKSTYLLLLVAVGVKVLYTQTRRHMNMRQEKSHLMNLDG